MKSIAIIGLGTMGTAIQERLALTDDLTSSGISRTEGNIDDVGTAETVILAVKPQSFPELAAELRPRIDRQLIVSIMAGISISTITESLGSDRVVRTMPNLALSTGQSVTGWYTESRADMDTVESIVDSWGSSIQLKNEEQFHAFTALAGSGPAYFYELTRILEQMAKEKGFSAEQASRMAVQTFLGAASVMSERVSPAEQVQRVASRGGTTEAALGVFQEFGLQEVVRAAIDAACVRSQELSG